MEIIQHSTQIKSNKPHRCDFCHQPIEKGTTYLKSVHKDSSEVYTWKSHQHCDDILNKLGVYDDVEYVGTEDFMETIRCEYNHILSESKIDPGDKKIEFRDKLSFVLNYHNILLKKC